MKNKSLSIIVPVFNEEKRISRFLSEAGIFPWSNHFDSVEFIIVNDGSKDGTLKIIRNSKLPHPLKIVSYDKNRGKGFALRQGVAQAVKDYCLLTDVDLSVPLQEIEKFMPHMESGHPIVIGSRNIEGSSVVRPQKWHRQKMGRFYLNLANLILGMGLSDFTCGFKILSTPLAKQIFSNSKVDTWSYDPEILFIGVKKMGLPVTEVPVLWQNDELTKVRLLKDILREFFHLISIKFRRYNRRRYPQD